MKKIIAILVCALTAFVSCNNSGEVRIPKPNFPEIQHFTVAAGESYDITFVAEKEWTISLPDEWQMYASITYAGYTEMQHYGEAGEHTITVNIKEGVFSYANDILVTVKITMSGYTESLAVLTIPLTPYDVEVTGAPSAGMELGVTSTFEKGGHPADGPFVSSAHQYTVRYLNQYDAEYGDFVVTHDLDLLYNYQIYVKNKKGEFEAVRGSSWATLRTFGTNKEHFSLSMNHKSSTAVLTKGVGYEAYVNLEDEYGDAIVSVYFLFDPDAVVEIPQAIELAFPEEAKAKGVTFEGDDYVYTLTIPSIDLLGDAYRAASLKITGYEGYTPFPQENIDLAEDKELEVFYVRIVDAEEPELLVRKNDLVVTTLSAISKEEYSITVILDWLEESEEKPAE